MTPKDAVVIAQGFTRLSLNTYLVFVLISLAFAGMAVLSEDIFETPAYDDKRKIMCIGYTLLSVTMLLFVLYLTARSNAALTLGKELMQGRAESQEIKALGVFRSMSTLWVLFFMTAIIITVNYIVLIYAVEGGLF